MNAAEIQDRFIRAAEVDRMSRTHVGPSTKVNFWPLYLHDQADKNGWGKAREARVVSKKGKLLKGDWLEEGDDPLAAERRAFWNRTTLQPTATELAEMDTLFVWLSHLDDEHERRALLAWARAKAGGMAFRRWCFQIEGIHQETGRRRKNKAVHKILEAHTRRTFEHYAERQIEVLSFTHELEDIPDTIAEDVGKREGLNSWMADDALPRRDGVADFNWANKRNERRRQQEAAKRKQARAA